MALISPAHALEILGPDHIQGVRAAVNESVGDYYYRYADDLRAVHDDTTRANIIHAHIRARIAEYAEKNPSSMRVQWCNRMFVLLVHDVVAIRFKKLSEHNITSNLLTGQVKAFKAQQNIPGLGVLHHLEAGYQIDPISQAATGVYILCPNGPEKNWWEWNLTENLTAPVVADIFEPLDAASIVDEETPAAIAPKRVGNVVPLKGAGEKKPS